MERGGCSGLCVRSKRQAGERRRVLSGRLGTCHTLAEGGRQRLSVTGRIESLCLAVFWGGNTTEGKSLSGETRLNEELTTTTRPGLVRYPE